MAVKFILRVSLLCYKFGTALRRYSKYLKKCLTRDSNQRPRKIIRFPGSHFIHWAMGTYKNRAISSMYDANRRIEHAELILRVSLLCYKFGTALRRYSKYFKKCLSWDLKHEQKTVTVSLSVTQSNVPWNTVENDLLCNTVDNSRAIRNKRDADSQICWLTFIHIKTLLDVKGVEP